MEIRPVASHSGLRHFIDLPYRLYRDDPTWVAPLRSAQWAQFDPQSNPMLNHCEYALFLLWDKEPIGRISAFVDRLAVEAWGEPIGLFGSYECVESAEGARMLLEAARAWLRERGLTKMRGPWSFASQEWGLVVEGFVPPPVIMAPYNPPWYNQQLADFGLAKVKDLLVYVIDCGQGYVFPERYRTVTDRVQERYGITVRTIDMDRLEDEVATLMDLGNQSIAQNWGFYPVTPEESAALARDLKRIIDPSAVLIAEGPDSVPIGFAIALPDINVLLRGLRGRLFPLGWLKLLWGLPRLRQYRVWALGVVAEYQVKAVDALMYRQLYDALYHRGVRLEINYVLEDNAAMNNAIRNLGATELRRYRVYEMAI